MALRFRTLRSGSSGNGQLLYAAGQAILIDLGIPANTALRQTLGELRQRGVRLVAAFVTHEHGDHFSAGALRAMSGLGVPVYAPMSAIRFAESWPDLGNFSGRPEFRAVDEGEAWERCLRVGPFTVRPVEVTHHATSSCFAYDITADLTGGIARAVLATDLCEPRCLPAALVDADLIYLEANHDPHLLQLRPNPASRFHLPNAACGALLASAALASRRAPQHLCLGHLSELRNTPTLAREAVTQAFSSVGLDLPVPLTTAPRFQPGVTVQIRPR